MAMYRGVVRGNKVELEGTAYLPDGLPVQIHTQDTGVEGEALEDLVEEQLRERGCLRYPFTVHTVRP